MKQLKKNIGFFIILLTLMPLLYLFNFVMALAQSDYDKMLNTLYSQSVPLIKSEELKDLIEKEDIILLDTRSPEEYSVSHLKDAEFINYKEFEIETAELPAKEKLIVVYCSVGYRSEKVGEQLLEAGYTNVYNLYGGIFQWVNEGNEVYKENSIPTDNIHAYSKVWSKWLKQGNKVYEE